MLLLFGFGFLALLVFLTKLGWEWIIRPEVRLELGATIQLPRWYNFSVLPLALAMTSVHQLAAVLRHLRDLGGHHA